MEVITQVTTSTMRLALDDKNVSVVSYNTIGWEMEPSETSAKILAIIFEYALNKFDSTVEQLTASTPKFLSVIDQFIAAGKRVEMCLPAFPFKSANKVYKVFGILPDKAEELAMERLNTMCIRIAQIYGPGARLTIISDGLVYNGK